MKHLALSLTILLAMCSTAVAYEPTAESSKDKPIYMSSVAYAAEKNRAPSPESRAPGVKDVHIIINIPATTMTLYENGKPHIRSKIAVGSGIYPTPEDKMTINHVVWNPWWIPPPSDWAKDDVKTPPGPGNPLGVVKIPMQKAIMLHGTNARSSVGRPASHGCMRMYNQDAAALAWYLQSNFSDKTDEALREKYKKYRRKSFHVRLNRRIPVDIIYDPVGVKNGELMLFPDYYNKVRGRRFDVIGHALTSNGVSRSSIDDDHVRLHAANWPRIERRLQIHRVTRSPEAKRILSLQPVDQDVRFFH